MHVFFVRGRTGVFEPPFLFDVLKIDPNSGWKLFHLESNLRVEEDNPGTLHNHVLNIMYEKWQNNYFLCI